MIGLDPRLVHAQIGSAAARRLARQNRESPAGAPAPGRSPGPRRAAGPGIPVLLDRQSSEIGPLFVGISEGIEDDRGGYAEYGPSGGVELEFRDAADRARERWRARRVGWR